MDAGCCVIHPQHWKLAHLTKLSELSALPSSEVRPGVSACISKYDAFQCNLSCPKVKKSTFLGPVAILSTRDGLLNQKRGFCLQVWRKLALGRKEVKPLFICSEMSIGPQYNPSPPPRLLHLLTAFYFW